jgi:hypothetical protein
MMYEVSEMAPKMRPEFTVGTRDKSDHIYKARAQVGLRKLIHSTDKRQCPSSGGIRERNGRLTLHH